jgi:hypothetical protein
MAMSAPFYKFGLFGDEALLIVAFLLGIGFGFFLERAGFGSARKLTSQFYFTDLAVFKVMFTAIVVAGLGVFYLGWAGVLDVSLIYLSPTYLVPQIVGGLLLGIGFTIGGYCPGTSLVGIATGSLDAVVYGLGIFAGIFVFGEIFPAITGFFTSTAMGELTLPQAFHMSYGLVLFLVVLMALGGFAGASWVERWMAARSGATDAAKAAAQEV